MTLVITAIVAFCAGGFVGIVISAALIASKGEDE